MAKKKKITAAILAMLLGGLGVHKFYLGEIFWGFIYLLFCLTGIPALVAFIEGISYIVMSQEEFDKNYNNKNENQ